jgi:hypothetical protein
VVLHKSPLAPARSRKKHKWGKLVALDPDWIYSTFLKFWFIKKLVGDVWVPISKNYGSTFKVSFLKTVVVFGD